MKAILILLFPIFLSAQTYPSRDNLYEIATDGTDTLGTSSTFTFEFEKDGTPVDFTTLYEYSLVVTSDSLSGANAGTVELQVSNSSEDDTTPIWYVYDTETIDGTADQTFFFEGLLRSRRIRLSITSPSGTRATKIVVEGTAKRVK